MTEDLERLNCLFLGKGMNCTNEEIAKILGAKLRICVRCLSAKEVCEFRKPRPEKKEKRT